MAMPQLASVQIACLVVFGLLLALGAWQDWRTMRIADALPLSIVATYVVWAACGVTLGTLSFASVSAGWIISGILFSTGMAAFAFGALGGGDVKLLAAASLFAGPTLVADFLMVTGLAGGLVGAVVLAGALTGRTVPLSQPNASRRSRHLVPYGPAIAIGGLWVAVSLTIA